MDVINQKINRCQP